MVATLIGSSVPFPVARRLGRFSPRAVAGPIGAIILPVLVNLVISRGDSIDVMLRGEGDRALMLLTQAQGSSALHAVSRTTAISDYFVQCLASLVNNTSCACCLFVLSLVL